MNIMKEAKANQDTQNGANKPVTAKFSVINRKAYQKTSFSESRSMNGYVSWGVNNRFPEYIWNTYMECSTLQSIINGCRDYTIGNGIVNNTIFKGENSSGETLQDVIEKCVLDHWVFGGFAIQVFYNKFGDILNIAYVNIEKCRVNEQKTKVFILNDFGVKGRKIPTLEFYAFGELSKQERAKEGTEILFHKGKKTKGYYPIPDYIASLISAEIQIEIKRFHYNNISNGMLSASIINFNNAEDVSDEVKDQIEKGIKSKFGGPEGAGEIMISWNADKDHELSVAKLDDDNFDAKFSTLAEDTREDLFISMRATPQLFGLALNTGFNSQEFEEAFMLANRTLIAPKQMEVTRCLDKIFSMGDYGEAPIHAIEFKKFTLNDEPKETEEENE